ncbi:unnamed protein product [Adineta steineri]|uniref:Uncharacterized protein n=1 Tax=Adineta steineri TaxID=433720 RepID=A0A819PFQ9_9BILA|nr:unnamed protein product [Adineta steineri]
MSFCQNQYIYDEQKQTAERDIIELDDRLQRFERTLEILRREQPKDHDRELIKRALAKQASKDAVEYQKLLTRKNEEIERLNHQLKQLSNLASALCQINIEKLYLERRLIATTTTTSSNSITNIGVSCQASY